MFAHERIELGSVDVAGDEKRGVVRPVPLAVVRTQLLGCRRAHGALIADRQARREARARRERRDLAIERARGRVVARAALGFDDARLAFDLLAIERQTVADVGEIKQREIENLLVVRNRELIVRVDKSRRRILMRAEREAGGLEAFQ